MRLVRSDVHEPVNLGNPNEVTVKEFAETVLRILGKPGEMICRPLPKDDPTRRKPDITRAKELLDWEPKVQIEEGLELTIDWFKKRLGYE